MTAFLLIAIVLAPLAATAQERNPAPVATAAVLDHYQFVRGRLLAVGAGALVGSLIGSYVVVFQGSLLAGGLAGALAGGWWYGAPDTLVLNNTGQGPTQLH